MAVSPLTVSGTKISRQLFPEPGQIVTEIGKKYIKVIILKSDSPAAVNQTALASQYEISGAAEAVKQAALVSGLAWTALCYVWVYIQHLWRSF